MQSVNEELQTINGELHGKNDLLMQANNDLQNLLDSTQIATIFLDDDLRIRNFTPAAMEVFPCATATVAVRSRISCRCFPMTSSART